MGAQDVGVGVEGMFRKGVFLLVSETSSAVTRVVRCITFIWRVSFCKNKMIVLPIP